MSWFEEPPWRRIESHPFRGIEAEEILYEFDGPRIFIVRDQNGDLNLFYWSDEQAESTIYVAVPTSAGITEALKQGRMSVHDALHQPRCWICIVRPDGQTNAVYSGAYELIPEDSRPLKGTMLWPTLEPILTLRAVGKNIEPGMVPGSVIRTCVEGVQKAFKVLSEHALRQNAQAGRPDEFLRNLFDLPTQRIAFSSFEISFRVPSEERDLFTANGVASPAAETLSKVSELLKKGLQWLKSTAGEEGIFSPDAPEEGGVLLRALKELTPSSYGNIEQLELRGSILGPRITPIVLQRADRQRVNNAIRNRSLEPQLVDLVGRVRELDKDRLSFELREIEGSEVTTRRCVFDEALLEEVFQAFQGDYRVRIAGQAYPGGNVAYALALSVVVAQ